MYNKLKTDINYTQVINVELLEKLRTSKKQNRELEKEKNDLRE